MMTPDLYPRYLTPALTEALAETPVVLVLGPRQSGKTTLVRQLSDAAGYPYLSFDDPELAGAVRTNPTSFKSKLPKRAVLDEVQRAPRLMSRLKAVIDADPQPGRLILTSSADVPSVHRLVDSLADRIKVLRLHPLAQVELAGTSAPFINRLFAADFPIGARPAGGPGPGLGPEIGERIATGGYPAALACASAPQRGPWYRDYVESLVHGDVCDLKRIGTLETLPRLLTMAAEQTTRLLNVTGLSRSFEVTRPTIRDYVTLLARIFLLDELPPWPCKRMSRLIRTPKVHLADTGITCAMLGLDGPALEADPILLLNLLETFVLQELKRQASFGDTPTVFYHLREKDGAESDVLMERGSDLAGVEVRTAATVTPADFHGFRRLRDTVGRRFRGGAVLYDGEVIESHGDGFFAVPLRGLWEGWVRG